MTPKERISGALKGVQIDRTPWSPLLAYFWESQSPSLRKQGQFSFLQEIGADPFLRGCSHRTEEVFRFSTHTFHGSEIQETVKGREKEVTYRTSIGSLHETYTYSDEAESWFLTKHPVKTLTDLQILMKLFESLTVSVNTAMIKKFHEDEKDLGERGYYVVDIAGFGSKTAFQGMLEHWLGTIDLVYMIADYPAEFQEALQIIREKNLEAVKCSLESNAECFIFWEDTSTTNISPDYFRSYIIDEINSWGALVHEKERLLVHHACGHLRNLLPLFSSLSIDAIESLTPFPTGDVDMAQARSILPSRIGIIGGIDPVFLQECSLQELEIYVRNLLTTMKGSRFVLSNSDSCPPGVSIEKLRFISKIVTSFYQL